MSIAPVQSFPPVASEQGRNQRLGTVQSQVAPAQPQTVSGSLPKQEPSPAKSVPSTDELSQDVVEVHQDPEIKDQIIIQYLDQAKNVVLQVPSNQELSVERGIAQEFQDAAKVRETAASATAGSEGEKGHGD
jgi:hypothetical protein